MPKFELVEPTELAEALALLAEHGDDALVVAGGTDLVPNMKHRLFEPKVLVSLARIEALNGVRALPDGGLAIGATTTLASVATDLDVLEFAPALAQAASLVAGPQLRSMGTLGGNVMLDTRCQWYNQTHFWRRSLGYCLKKDGTTCHVVAGGKKCVAAASNDTAPALMTLGARLVFESARGAREVAIDELWKADGVRNKHLEAGEVLTRIVVPRQAAGHRGAYGKLRDRGSIDFPLFGCAVRLDLATDDSVLDAAVAAVALVARPIFVKRTDELLRETRVGTPEFAAAVDAVAEEAYRQCKPMPNVPGDADYRREMVPVYVRRTLHAAAQGAGPVHHV
ncbi:MAG: FAD binding domain-containing protein [Planctomycetota bacterium]